MRDEEAIVLLALGIAALRRSVDWGDPALWCWPLPRIDVGGAIYPPTISDGPGSPRPGGRIHQGVDLCYRRKSRADRPEYAPTTASGTALFFAPPGIPVVAARNGRIWSVAETARGWAVVVDHGKPWATFYQHLSSVALPRHDRGASLATGRPTLINRGDVLGVMGADPMQGEAAFRHVHFEVWHGGGASKSVDPSAAMSAWPFVSWIAKPGAT